MHKPKTHILPVSSGFRLLPSSGTYKQIPVIETNTQRKTPAILNQIIFGMIIWEGITQKGQVLAKVEGTSTIQKHAMRHDETN